jgi:hypothetical protein
MYALQPVPACCPYCGEPLELLADPSAGEQDYVEDCEVCCRPMSVHLAVGPDGLAQLTVRHEEEV